LKSFPTIRVYTPVRLVYLGNFLPIRLNDKPQSTPKIRTQMARTHTCSKSQQHIHTYIYSTRKRSRRQSLLFPATQPSVYKDPSVGSNFPWSYMRAYQHAADFRCYSRGACLPNTNRPPKLPGPLPPLNQPTPRPPPPLPLSTNSSQQLFT